MIRFQAIPTRTALVVDDQRSNRALIGALLRREGYAVVPASDGGEAWRMLQQRDVDVSVTDLNMPDVSGEELIETVRLSDDAVIRNLPIVVVSSESDVITRADVRALKADAFLPKPVDVDELIETVEMVA